MGIVDRLQALDERFLPSWAKPRRPETPPEWAPEVGALAPFTAPLAHLATAFAVGGGALLVFDVVQEGWRALVSATILVAVNGLVIPRASRGPLLGSIERARPVRTDVPSDGGRVPNKLGVTLFIAAATVMLFGIALSSESGGVPGGASLGVATGMVVQVRWLRRWEREHGAELLVPDRRRWGGGLYVRPKPASDRSASFSGG